MKHIEEYWTTKCPSCFKTAKHSTDPGHEEMWCAKCKKEAPVPVRESWHSLEDFLVEIEDFRYKTGREVEYSPKQFKIDLIKEFDLKAVSPEKVEKAYDIVWQHCHSEGYREMYFEFKELVDLMK